MANPSPSSPSVFRIPGADNNYGRTVCKDDAAISNRTTTVELLASYSNTAPQVSELYSRVLGMMREPDGNDTSD